ncbi:MAG: FtsQ-type POTRA domain-containing protein [Roseburia sp.]|nr:FtsQ-type POTRA domain-containing protein [Roseburia sp.]
MRNRKLIALLSVVATLVIVIIACGATFLVRHVEAYNYYESSPEFDEKIIDAAAIKTNSSMFFLDELDIKNRVESEFVNVGVVNVERKFPDRVSINYIVYGSSFQYLAENGYCQCYASGRIGSTSNAPIGGYFIVKPRNTVSESVGSYFQSSDGFDRNIVNTLIEFMYSTGLNDRQIAERIDFVDLTRDGYVYIRTSAGCSIEIGDDGEMFGALLEEGWSCFADPKPDSPVEKSAGLIRTYVSRIDADNSKITNTYSATDGDAYYLEKYVNAQ